MEKKQFKAESKKLLDMMINSIYTHKEIFLRELISNASDAIDKLYYRSLTEDGIGMSREDYAIKIDVNADGRTLTIADNGCGMAKEDLENNLGTIAQSGSLDFKKSNDVASKEDVEIIGQFGVGFYSAFMVSDKVVVKSKAYGSDEAFCWEATGADGYTVEPCEKDSFGTEITLYIKESTEENDYEEFLDTYAVSALVKKYSDYISYPIKMDFTTTNKGEDDVEETVVETQTVNSMVPLWRKNKNEITKEEYNNFYKEKYYDYVDPMRVIHSRVEGVSTFDALLFIPQKPAFDYYSKEYEKGLQLYSNGVLVMNKCSDLLPDYFSFVHGLVDSADLSLNISREMLQQDHQLKSIAKTIEKKIQKELLDLMKKDRESYETFFQAFGVQLKFGVYNDYGMHKDTLKDLLLYYSSTEKKLVSLHEYVSRMQEGQKDIYYAGGETYDKIDRLPQVEAVKDKGYEVLYFSENIDEFVIKVLSEYEEKHFVNVCDEKLDLETESEKETIKEKNETAKELLELMKEGLAGVVSKVRFTGNLKNHPVCLSSEGNLSIEMAKTINAMPTENKVDANLVLEINVNHPIAEKLKDFAATDSEKVKVYAKILYGQACLIGGLPVENPTELSDMVCDMMLK